MNAGLSTRARLAAIDLAQRTQRVDPARVYLNSFQGRYSDSPRAIAEQLADRADLQQVWRADPEHLAGFPADLATVPGGSLAHVRALGGARYVVANGWMVSHPKRPGQTWLQTWHGTPLKRIALDAASGVTEESRRAIRRDVRKWDYLVSPNAFSTELFRAAFGYAGEILETGYPRNDILSSPEAPGVAERVRQELGIEPDRTVVLYAPTWRDKVVSAGDPDGASLLLDLEETTRELGDSHVLLLRLHPFIAAEFADMPGYSTLNVSRHPDIRELYLAADVLVTDYSSAMFDFAVTGKPILFLAPDLEHYRDQMRGFYFDFEAETPGPISRTTPELISHLNAISMTRNQWAPAYAAFRERFCGLEDGQAAARVVDAVFGRAGR